jgi:hypothetical protein
MEHVGGCPHVGAQGITFTARYPVIESLLCI